MLKSPFLVASLLICIAATASAAEPLKFTARHRATQPGSDEPYIREKRIEWAPGQTAIIVCDVWDQHWCEGANRRVGEMVERMNRIIAAARDRGVLIIHAPSDTMMAYEGTPQRKLAQSAPPAKNTPADIARWNTRLPDEPKLPIDDSDGGCDCQPKCKTRIAWKGQHPAIPIAEADAISDQGVEIWNLLEQRGIRNVIIMGVHTNMCILGRPFGLRNLSRYGRNVVLARDLTDAMYNPRMAPMVSHRRGTQLVIEHIERHVCPTIQAADILAPLPGPEALFMIGEDEYDMARTLPEFARKRLEPLGIHCTFVVADEKSPNDFAGLERLKKADLLVLAVRRRTPTSQQMRLIRDHLDDGRPLVALRTASHAFDATPPDDQHAAWPDFDTQVLGADYQNHYGNKPPDGPRTAIRPNPQARAHPILAATDLQEMTVTSHLYRNRNLARIAVPLAFGKVVGRTEEEPVAWTHRYKGGKVFYTSLGNPDDLQIAAVQRLVVNAILWALDEPVHWNP